MIEIKKQLCRDPRREYYYSNKNTYFAYTGQHSGRRRDFILAIKLRYTLVICACKARFSKSPGSHDTRPSERRTLTGLIRLRQFFLRTDDSTGPTSLDHMLSTLPLVMAEATLPLFMDETHVSNPLTS